MGRVLCRKPYAFYQGSWSANQYAPISTIDVRLLTRLYLLSPRIVKGDG